MNNRFNALKTDDSKKNRFQKKSSPGRFGKKEGRRFENSRFNNKNKVNETNEKGQKKWRRKSEMDNNKDRGHVRENNFKTSNYKSNPNYDPRKDVKLKQQTGFSTFGELDITGHLLKSKQMKQKEKKELSKKKELPKMKELSKNLKEEEEIT